MSKAWTSEEVEATVADYLDMLTKELTGQHYSKTDHRHRLLRLLDNRTEGAIERKHQNISAILIELHCPWISGYKPLGNYQELLFDVVEARLKNATVFDDAALAATQMPAVAPEVNNFSSVEVEAPRFSRSMHEPIARSRVARSPAKRDYIDREARNISLGRAGEEFVVHYEQWRLTSLGESRLADKIEHVAATQGDGLGYDVLSFDTNGRERLIEVKTTSFGKETPFFITRNEVDLSKTEADLFHIYRLFDFRKDPRLFTFRGAVDRHCNLDALIFQARFS